MLHAIGGSPAKRGSYGRNPESDHDGKLHRLVEWMERFQSRHAWLAVPYATVKKFGEDRAGSLAGLIAYYGFFSLFPLLLVLVTVLGIILSGDEDLQAKILDSALAEFPVIGDQIRENAGSLDTNGFGLVVGIGSALWAGTGVMKAAEDAMNDVWEVPMRQRPTFMMMIVRAMGMLVLLGGGIVLTTVLTGVAGGLGTGPALRAVGLAVGAALNIGILLFGFHILTVRDVGVRKLFPGAATAGIIWMVLQALGGYLLNNQIKGAGQTYGTFAVVIGLLWWLNLQAQIILLCAEFNVVLAYRLWPRSIIGSETDADRRALRLHAEVQERRDAEGVQVRFDNEARSFTEHESADRSGGH